jgi:putative acetyltransferase
MKYWTRGRLQSVYVSDRFRGKGVGSALLQKLESLAKERGCKDLTLDSSLTAEPFYLHHGYMEVWRADHTLSSGQKMACVKMQKTLE